MYLLTSNLMYTVLFFASVPASSGLVFLPEMPLVTTRNIFSFNLLRLSWRG